jgi:hypothetical protein
MHDTYGTLLSFCPYSLRALSRLLALMSVLAQALLALVSSHLVALLLFSVWHNVK